MTISVTTWAAAIVLTTAVAAIGVQSLRLANERAGRATDQATYQGERVEAARLTTKSATEQRDEFERRIKEKDDVIKTAKSAIAAKGVALGKSELAHTRLRESTGQLVTRAREACRGADPGNGGAPADDPIGVLADVLGRIDARAGILASYADDARIAGQACERSYNSLSIDSAGLRK